jgi:hypothetical protein
MSLSPIPVNLAIEDQLSESVLRVAWAMSCFPAGFVNRLDRALNRLTSYFPQ